MVSSMMGPEQMPESMGLLTNLFIPFTSFGSFAANTSLYLIAFCPILLLFFFFGIITFLRSKKNYLQQYFLIACSLISLILILYYGGGAFYGAGFGYPAVGSSFVRYFIPIYAFFAVYAGVFLARLSYRKILLVFLVLIIPMSTATSYFDRFFQERRGIEFLGRNFIPTAYYNSQGVIENTEENAVIFCTHQDWIVYPHRNTAMYNILMPEEHRVQEVTELVSQLNSDGIPVYFLQEDWYWVGYKSDVYFESFRSEGLDAVPVYKFMKWSGAYSEWDTTLWRITKGDQNDE